MTDKEQIIIDGVDVRGCKDRYCGTNCGNTGLSCPDIMYENNANCYYKQLQRKEQECEELKRQLKNSFEEKTILNTIIDRLLFNSGYNQCTASAEELEDVYADMEYKREAFEDYKQALGKIEEYCTIQQAYDGDLPFKTQLDDILDIINEVKDA